MHCLFWIGHWIHPWVLVSLPEKAGAKATSRHKSVFMYSSCTWFFWAYKGCGFTAWQNRGIIIIAWQALETETGCTVAETWPQPDDLPYITNKSLCQVLSSLLGWECHGQQERTDTLKSQGRVALVLCVSELLQLCGQGSLCFKIRFLSDPLSDFLSWRWWCDITTNSYSQCVLDCISSCCRSFC